MRIRTILLLVVIALLATFVALNLDEFMRISPLNLGYTTVEASLGFVLLSLLVLLGVIFLGSMQYMQSTHLRETRRYSIELNHQRELADKAEASRFTELRSYLEIQALAAQQREAASSTVLAERFAQHQEALLVRLEQTDNSIAAYMGQLEDRLERLGPGRPPVERHISAV